jgi:Zn-dependent M16 (insulinase) family peptidase
MWQSVRGTGLAYGTNFFRDPETGLLKFRIYKSPNAFSAYNKAKTVVKEYGDGTRTFDKLALEGAISSIVREFVDERASIIDAARSSFIDLVTRNVGKDWQDWALREVRKVTVEDVQKILRDVVSGVFVPEKADLVVTCGGIMTDVSGALP